MVYVLAKHWFCCTTSGTRVITVNCRIWRRRSVAVEPGFTQWWQWYVCIFIYLFMIPS